jgi:hypothetical protein
VNSVPLSLQEFREVCDKRKKGVAKLPNLPIKARTKVFAQLQPCVRIRIAGARGDMQSFYWMIGG